MSSAGPLDSIWESPSIDEPSSLTSPEDGGVKWTVRPAATAEHEEEPRSPLVKLICDRICKKGSYTRNYKYLEIPI